MKCISSNLVNFYHTSYNLQNIENKINFIRSKEFFLNISINVCKITRCKKELRYILIFTFGKLLKNTAEEKIRKVYKLHPLFKVLRYIVTPFSFKEPKNKSSNYKITIFFFFLT